MLLFFGDSSFDRTARDSFVSQVVGVKDERLGEQVCACIRLKNGQTSSAEEIKAFCKGQVRSGGNCQTITVQFVNSPFFPF